MKSTIRNLILIAFCLYSLFFLIGSTLAPILAHFHQFDLSGKLTISDFHTTAIDGTYIPLSGTVSSNPEDKMVLSIVLSVFVCPLFLLLKGGEGSLPAGKIKTAYTITDISVNTNRI